MIKITNEVDGKLYEIVPEEKFDSCIGCAFNKRGACKKPIGEFIFNRVNMCISLSGIWKEVRDGEKAM